MVSTSSWRVLSAIEYGMVEMQHSPLTYTVVPVAALAVIAILDVMIAVRALAKHRSDLGTSDLIYAQRDILWTLPFLVMLGFIAVWCWMGRYTEGFRALIILTIGAIVGVVLVMLRPFERKGLQALPFSGGMAVTLLRDALLLVVSTVVSFFALESSWNEALPAMAESMVVVNFALIAIFLIFLYLLGQRSGVLVAFGVMALAAVGVAQYFVAMYKGTAILPSDLTGLGTLAAVGGGYQYELSARLLENFTVVLVTVGALSLMQQVPVRKKKRRALSAIANSVLAAAVLAGTFVGFTAIDFVDDLGMEQSYWVSLPPYQAQGFLPSFFTLLQRMEVEVPEGYTQEKAEEIEARYVEQYDEVSGSSPARLAAEQQFEAEKPTVIAIMNESFSDLSLYNGLGVGYPGPAQFNSLDSVVSGSVEVSVLGGGTCNSEFEFLTGGSLSFIGAGKFPYNEFDLSAIPSLPKQFSTMGYETIAIHPQAGSNWNRENAYKYLGFNQFLTIDDFPDAEYFHSGPRDAVTYDKIIELVQVDDTPKFIFDVTMQNHGGYELGYSSEALADVASIPGLDANMYAQVNDYLACVEASERDLVAFLDELRGIGKPVVVIFFGDHQPGLAGSLATAFLPGEDATISAWRQYQTPYLIWSNYGLQAGDFGPLSSTIGLPLLGSVALNLIGAPMTDFQKASLTAMQEVTAYNAVGAQLPDGSIVSMDSDQRPQVINDISYIQYRNVGDSL